MPKKKKTQKRSTQRIRKARPRKPARKRVRKSKNATSAFNWDMVPFVVAVVVAMIVVVQSLNTDYRYQETTGALTIRETSPIHRAAEDCNLSGAPLRELKTAERALKRTVEAMDDADALYAWECASHASHPDCMSAKRGLRRENRQVQQKIQELQMMRVQGCL